MGAGEEILKKLSDVSDGVLTVIRRLGEVEAKLDRLLASGASAGGGGGGDALPDHQLDNSWADKEIKKDPARYGGPSMIGRRYSEATSEWHEANASFLDWKAQKGREEVPVRMNNKGKPWHEADAFEARLCRAWARRLAGRPAAPRRDPEPPFGGNGGGAPADDPLPF